MNDIEEQLRQWGANMSRSSYPGDLADDLGERLYPIRLNRVRWFAAGIVSVAAGLLITVGIHHLFMALKPEITHGNKLVSQQKKTKVLVKNPQLSVVFDRGDSYRIARVSGTVPGFPEATEVKLTYTGFGRMRMPALRKAFKQERRKRHDNKKTDHRGFIGPADGSGAAC